MNPTSVRENLNNLKNELEKRITLYNSEIDALTNIITWNRSVERQSTNTIDIENLMEQLAVNQVINNYEYPILMPSEEVKNMRIERLKGVIKASIASFNIRFDDCRCIPLSGEIGQSYIIKGISNSISFELNFDSLKGDDSKASVSKLRIQIKGGVFQELADFIKRCQSENDLPGFFNGLKQYSQYHDARKSTIKRIKEEQVRFLDHEIVSNDTLLRFCDPSKEAAYNMSLTYSLKIDNNNKVHSQVDMLPKYNFSLRYNSKIPQIIAEIPEQFHNLCKMKGIPKATEIILKTLYDDME